MPTPLGPSGALKVAYELIDAQATYIKALERGHWPRELRAAVQEKRDELDIIEAQEQRLDPPTCPSACAATNHPGAEHPRMILGLDWGKHELARLQAGDDIEEGYPREVREGDIIGYAGTTGYGTAYPPTCPSENAPIPGCTDPDRDHLGPCSPQQIEVTNCEHVDIGQPPTVGYYPAGMGEDPPEETGNIQSWADNLPPDTPAAAYIAAYARLQAAIAAAPEHDFVPHQEGAWAPGGQCRRCDILQPLVDEEQRLHAALARHNREAGIQHDGDPS